MRERERESFECKNFRLRTLVEVRTEMAVRSRVVPRRRNIRYDWRTTGDCSGCSRPAAGPAGVSSCYILLKGGERRQRGSGEQG